MPPIAQRTKPHDLARRVLDGARQPAASRVLLLDVDGTLAPIAPTPEAAAVPVETLDVLGRLVGLGWTVVLVSGRPLDQVLRMVPVPGVQAFGSHGLESSLEARAARVATPVRKRLETVQKVASRAADGFSAVRVERKPLGVAFHDRALAPADLARWQNRLEDWLESQQLDGLEIVRGKRVVEVRVSGGDKGLAVRAMKDGPGPAIEEDPTFVAIGDDVTDEDMFRAIRGRGLAVRVGEGSEPTAARWILATPQEVGQFLAELAGGGRSASDGKDRA